LVAFLELLHLRFCLWLAAHILSPPFPPALTAVFATIGALLCADSTPAPLVAVVLAVLMATPSTKRFLRGYTNTEERKGLIV
jgi:hypothetical protein